MFLNNADLPPVLPRTAQIVKLPSFRRTDVYKPMHTAFVSPTVAARALMQCPP